MKQLLSLVLLAVSLTSCVDEDIISPSWNEDDFEPISSLQPFADVVPAYDFDYWELVWHSEQDEFVHFRFGSICKDAEDPMKCAQQFYGIDQSGTGFQQGGPAEEGNYYYLRSNEQGYNKYWYSREELSAFLGAIDSKGDALLVTAANGYYFEKNDQAVSGIKQEDKAYRVIALKTISDCSPYQVNKVLVEIDQNARLKVLDEEVYIRTAGPCEADQKNE